MFGSADRSVTLDQRDQLIHQNLAKARAQSDAKTSRLKALRLAREASEKEAALVNPPEKKG